MPFPPSLCGMLRMKAQDWNKIGRHSLLSRKKMTHEPLIEPPGATFPSSALIFHNSERVDKSQ